MSTVQPRIGLLLNRFFKFYAHEVVEGMMAYAAEHQHSQLVDLRFFGLEDARQRLESNSVDGLIVGLNHAEYEQLKASLPSHKPIINVHPDILSPRIPSVSMDPAVLAERAVDYFAALGYQHLSFFSVPGSDSADQLARALHAAAEQQRLSCSATTIVLPQRFYETAEMEIPTAFRRWVEALPKPVGVVTTGGYTALLVERVAHKLGLQVPGDIATLSISDDEVCLFCNPPVSSVQSVGPSVGELAIRMLDHALRGKALPSGRIAIAVPNIIERRSTGFPVGMPERVKQAMRYIRAHACEGITVSEVVTHVSATGRTHLYNQFKRHLKRSPAAEIRRIRIARAKYLLVHTTLSCTDICGECGYEQSSHFSAIFRQTVGMPPNAWRKQLSTAPVHTIESL